MKKIVVIGDVHGCIDELKEMMETNILPIINELENVVFVGDYIDRGPDSKGCFDYIQEIPKVVMLKGNHEDMMAQELIHGRPAYWAPNGGYQTVFSYAHDQNKMFDDALLMDALPVYFEFGRVLVSHAGIDPTLPLSEQSTRTMIWGRDHVGYKGDYKDNLFSIYGHTPVGDIINRPNQLGIDTGCVFGNKLSAVVVNENGEWLQEFSVQSRQKKW